MVLVFDNVTKRYPNGHLAVEKVSVEVAPGVFGLLGPNGAGKTTLMNMVATITKPTLGAISYGAVNIQKEPFSIRRILGYLPQEFGLYPNLTGREYLLFLAKLKGVPNVYLKSEITKVLQQVDMLQNADRLMKSYSGGMKQRIAIAQALLKEPELLVIDEPTAGLDPAERVRFRRLLQTLIAGNSKIIILSTHIVPDLEFLADQIGLMNKGKIIENDTPANLISSLQGKVWEGAVKPEVFEKLEKEYIVASAQNRGDTQIHCRLIGVPPQGLEFKTVMPVMEDVYLHRVRRANLA